MLDIYCSGQFVLIELVVQSDDAFILWGQYPPHSFIRTHSVGPLMVWGNQGVLRSCECYQCLFGATIIFFRCCRMMFKHKQHYRPHIHVCIYSCVSLYYNS